MPNPELDDGQRDKLVLDHLEQVQFVARRIHSRLPPQVVLEDLVHAGVLGLIDAVRKYDPSRNVQLKHYAKFRIRGAILDSLREVDWSPRTLRRQARRLDRAIADCKARLGRDPSEFEIAGELQISIESLQRLLGELRGLDIGSLQSEGDDFGGETLNQPRAGSDEQDPYHQTLRSEMRRLLERAIAELPVRERVVLVLYYFDELTMKEIGAMLRVGESRVSQIHTAALLRLRARLLELLGETLRHPSLQAFAGARRQRRTGCTDTMKSVHPAPLRAGMPAVKVGKAS
jgi:RNA polymerase sigma factor FliA